MRVAHAHMAIGVNDALICEDTICGDELMNDLIKVWRLLAHRSLPCLFLFIMLKEAKLPLIRRAARATFSRAREKG